MAEDYPNKFFRISFPRDGVLHVEINRPGKLNALHKAAYLEYGEIIRKAGTDSSVRAVVVSGVGRALCSGLDVPDMAPEFAAVREDRESSRAALALVSLIKEFQRSIGMPTTIPKPVIGVAHGPSIGLAVDLLCATDVRFAAADTDTRFSVREIDIGMAADIGTLQRLPKIANNVGWVKDVCFSGRNFDTTEALANGFVQYALPTKDDAVKAALDYAAELATKSPVAMLGTKKSINYALEHTTQDSLNQIAEFNGYALGEDFVAGSMAMLSKSKPRYEKL